MNRETLIPRLFELTRKFSRDDLSAKLEAAGVPAGPINTVADVFSNPQVNARGMRVDLPHPAAKGGSIPGVRTPITINGRRAAADRAPPRLGEHTEEVLREIGESLP
jgi:crotonobetainyl-CoA:carnitine CoA-transferase CaiB-like acyl-CoA transferase